MAFGVWCECIFIKCTFLLRCVFLRGQQLWGRLWFGFRLTLPKSRVFCSRWDLLVRLWWSDSHLLTFIEGRTLKGPMGLGPFANLLTFNIGPKLILFPNILHVPMWSVAWGRTIGPTTIAVNQKVLWAFPAKKKKNHKHWSSWSIFSNKQFWGSPNRIVSGPVE